MKNKLFPFLLTLLLLLGGYLNQTRAQQASSPGKSPQNRTARVSETPLTPEALNNFLHLDTHQEPNSNGMAPLELFNTLLLTFIQEVELEPEARKGYTANRITPTTYREYLTANGMQLVPEKTSVDSLIKLGRVAGINLERTERSHPTRPSVTREGMRSLTKEKLYQSLKDLRTKP